MQLGDALVYMSLATVGADFSDLSFTFVKERESENLNKAAPLSGHTKKQRECTFFFPLVFRRFPSTLTPSAIGSGFEICFGTAEPSRVVLILTPQMECVRESAAF